MTAALSSKDCWEFMPLVEGRPYLVRVYPAHRDRLRHFIKVYRLGKPYRDRCEQIRRFAEQFSVGNEIAFGSTIYHAAIAKLDDEVDRRIKPFGELAGSSTKL